MSAASLPARLKAPSTAHPVVGPRVFFLNRPLRDHGGLRAYLPSAAAYDVAPRREAPAGRPKTISAWQAVPAAPASVTCSLAAAATALATSDRRSSQTATEAEAPSASPVRAAPSLRAAHAAVSAMHVRLRQAVADTLHGLWRSPCRLAAACGLLAAACAFTLPTLAAAAVSQRLFVCVAAALMGLFVSVVGTSALRHFALARNCGVFAGTVAGLAALAAGLGAGVAAGIATGAAVAAGLAVLALCAMSPTQRLVAAGLVLVLLAALFSSTPAGGAWLATMRGPPAEGARHAR